MTYNDWLTAGNIPPSILNTIPTDPSTTFEALFTYRYGKRELFTEDADEFGNRFNESAAILAPFYKTKLDNLATLVENFMADSEEELEEGKAAPLGSTDFSSAYSTGGTIRKRSGSASGDPERLRAYAEIVNPALNEALDAFQTLFMGVL